ncbi:MAG: Uma2 family endonuclease [Methylococcales bacterium]
MALLILRAVTLDIAGGLMPDISVFGKESIHPDFFHDVLKYPQPPILAVEVISPSQTIRSLLEKARLLNEVGVRAVWTVEPYSRSVFVTTAEGVRLYHGEAVESEGIRVDFARVFACG